MREKPNGVERPSAHRGSWRCECCGAGLRTKKDAQRRGVARDARAALRTEVLALVVAEVVVTTGQIRIEHVEVAGLLDTAVYRQGVRVNGV